MIANDELAEVFVEVADTLIDDFDLVDFVQMITTRTTALFDFSAVGLLLTDQAGRLHLMAASDERTEMLELFQMQAQEGPCQDCFTTGELVTEEDMATATGRWPLFAPRALEAGFSAVHAFPMRLRGQVIGALNVFSVEASPMNRLDMLVVQALADVATVGLLQERAIRRGEVLAEQLQSALDSRIAIEQAKGALSQIHRCTTNEAFEMLRGYARAHGRSLTEVATQVTTDPEQVSELVRSRD